MSGVEAPSLNLLQAEGPAELLHRIDELRNLGFQHRICLPQIAICGNRGCGKTSVFQSITGIQLPVSSHGHTRFATEVIFRRSPEVYTHTSIRPALDANPEHRRKLAAFSSSDNWLEDIPNIFMEAENYMNLTTDAQYSQDVLQLEVSGPSLPDLTVIDLPGLLPDFEGNQQEEDVIKARELTEFYINNPRSIVLVVVSADTPLAQQSVLRLAEPCASRSMGIVTKLDTLSPDSVSLTDFYARVKCQDARLHLGWHALKNIDTRYKDSLGLDRDDTESLFFSSSAPWKALSPNAIGIDSLRDRLNKVLLGQVELQLSMLASEIQKDLEVHRKSLQKLGPEMPTMAERRLYMTNIGETVQRLAREATLGQYHDPYFRSNSNRSIKRLRSVVRRWAEDFATDLRQRGHSHHIYDGVIGGVASSAGFPDDPQPIPRSEYIGSVLELLKSGNIRGMSGSANVQIVGELFIRYSSKWEKITKAHISEIWKKVKQFLDGLLHHIAGFGIGEAVMREIINREMEEKLRKTNAKVDELLLPYKKLIPVTLNQQLSLRIRHIRRRNSEQSNSASSDVDIALCNEILDCMQAYYSVALGVFLDNVAGLAVENCLLDGIENLLSPTRILQMSDNELERLAADSKELRSARAAVARKVRVFEVAAAACTRCQMAALESSSQNYDTLPEDHVTRSNTSASNSSSLAESYSLSESYGLAHSDSMKHKRTASAFSSRAFPVPARALDSPFSPSWKPSFSAGSSQSSPRRSSSVESDELSASRSPLTSRKPTNDPNTYSIQISPTKAPAPELPYPSVPGATRMYSHGRALSVDKLMPINRELLSPIGLAPEGGRHNRTLSAERMMPPLPETMAFSCRHSRALSAGKATGLPDPPPKNPARTLSLSMLTGLKSSGLHASRKRISKIKPTVDEKPLLISSPFNFHHHGSVPTSTDTLPNSGTSLTKIEK
ncbi:hypothetical protein LOZ64_000634 [Ophidiomyces ophidiicola]|nr:hypothetical protein LOZ64_000634 [Ophidiomyces ophidiicola]KAI2015830.1 hypothetical protein LOZ49_000415 [Ophidiomyces ophidiicola]KAI2026415.1 hypothetical protein LOZ46_000407 [Ophidiomyces ophidiicola]KAI2145252.1 hypothetical protein LOZ29_000415 [Ophidiomyces ophidiicola]KAI2147600.1 hypothetical protein LOZ28_000115 [Ophidiomyces ophidiicola]